MFCFAVLVCCLYVLKGQAYTCLPKQLPCDNIGAFALSGNAFYISTNVFNSAVLYLCFEAIVCVLLFVIIYNLHSSTISHNKPDELLLSIVPLTIRNMKHHQLH